jgi:hypothetical protein
MSNCYFWTFWKILTEGGKVKWYKSKTWFGYHCTWIDSKGIEWEYTMPRMTKKPLWYIPILYKGKIRRVRRQRSNNS